MVSDAGTPGICDPGAQLAEACIAAKLTLHPIPGPSAVIAALSVCGFSSSEFRFLGFIPFRGSPKDAFIDKIRNSPEVVVFFEAPHRVLDTFSALVKAGQGDRHCLCAREITKLYEELHYSTVAECELEGLIFLTNRRNLSLGLAWLQHRDSDLSEKSIKGEFTIVVGPHSRGDGSGASADEKVSVIALLEQLRADGVSRSEAVKLVTEMTKGPKAKVYKTALEIDDW